MAPPSSRFQPAVARSSVSNRRTSARPPQASSMASPRNSAHSPSLTICSSSSSCAESTINSIIFRQPSILGLEEERQSFPRGLSILEPRPIVYWSSVEERMGSEARRP